MHLFLYLFNMYFWVLYLFSSVRSLSHVQLFGIPWTAARQTSLSITNSLSLLKFMSIESWCHPTISSSVAPLSSCLQSFPASTSFPVSQFFTSDGQSIGASASASVLSMNIQDWFHLGLTGLISLQSKGLSSLLQHHSSKPHRIIFITILKSSNFENEHSTFLISQLQWVRYLRIV